MHRLAQRDSVRRLSISTRYQLHGIFEQFSDKRGHLVPLDFSILTSGRTSFYSIFIPSFQLAHLLIYLFIYLLAR